MAASRLAARHTLLVLGTPIGIRLPGFYPSSQALKLFARCYVLLANDIVSQTTITLSTALVPILLVVLASLLLAYSPTKSESWAAVNCDTRKERPRHLPILFLGQDMLCCPYGTGLVYLPHRVSVWMISCIHSSSDSPLVAKKTAACSAVELLTF